MDSTMSTTATRTTNNADQQAGIDGCHTASPFFKLPIELRLAVYEEVLLAVTEAVSTADGPEEEPKLININSKDGKPGLLRTSRTIRAEAAPIFLKNKFNVAILDFDTTACDTWFSFFKGFDTAKVDMQIEWRKSRELLEAEHMANLIAFVQAAYHVPSHIFPESPVRQWGIAISEYTQNAEGSDVKAMLLRSKLERLLSLIPDSPSSEGSGLVATMRALAPKVQELQGQGLA